MADRHDKMLFSKEKWAGFEGEELARKEQAQLDAQLL
jgi:hypothetical protein